MAKLPTMRRALHCGGSDETYSLGGSAMDNRAALRCNVAPYGARTDGATRGGALA